MPPAGAGNGNISYVGVSGGGGGGTTTVPIPIVSNIAALEALSVAGYIHGQPAIVQSVMAIWSLQAPSTATLDGITAVSASDGEQIWQRSDTLIAPQAIRTQNWFIDPVGGNDENSGTASGTPLKTFAEIVRRYGTRFPVLTTNTITYTWLNDGVASDPYNLVPTIIDGGGVLVKGTLVLQTTVTLGTFTARVMTTGSGTRNTITATGQSGAFWTPYVGMTVHDTTAGAQFFIDADLGTATAAITEPVTLPVSAIPALHAIANGDTLQVYRPSVVYFTEFDCVALGTGVGGGLLATQLTTNADFLLFVGPNAQFAEVSNKAPQWAFRTGPSIPTVGSCYFFAGSTWVGPATILAGSCCNTQGCTAQNRTLFDLYTLVNLRPHTDGVINVGEAYFGQWFTDTGGVQTFCRYVVQKFNGTTAIIWGPTTIAIDGGEQFELRGGITAAATLVATGGLTMDGAATGFTFNNATGAFSAGPVALTPAALDTNVSFQNPRTGTRFVVGS